MLLVPVISASGKPLMPCHPARARALVSKGRAIRRFDRGVFYIKLTDRIDGAVQPVAVGIDPGSKWEGFTVKSAKHTFLNVHADAVTWVSDVIKTRREMRRGRRFRKTPCRQNRKNRARGGLPPSTKARWQWKLRLARWLARLYPIAQLMVEDIKVKTAKGKGSEARHWNSNFSPLQVGKHWFYAELEKIAPVMLRTDTAELREQHGLSKTDKKSAQVFASHCVDSWVLANSWTGGHVKPDNTRLLCVTPLRFHRRQLHKLQPGPGGVRRAYGGTHSLGFRRGAIVRHPNWGVTYVGGTSNSRISLHSIATGGRLTQNARPEDLRILLPYNSQRTRLLPGINAGVSGA
jgi:RRXRR protein